MSNGSACPLRTLDAPHAPRYLLLKALPLSAAAVRDMTWPFDFGDCCSAVCDERMVVEEQRAIVSARPLLFGASVLTAAKAATRRILPVRSQRRKSCRTFAV